jgi:DNA polymerase-3 subunit delta
VGVALNMLIFLYGQDTYRSRDELKKIIEEREKASLNWFNFIRIDAKENELEIFEQISQTANTVSMFNEQKLIVVENILSAPEEMQKNILDLLRNKNIEKDPNTTIIFWTDEKDAKNEFFEYLKTKAKFQEFKLLEGNQLRKWIRDYINEQKGRVDSSAIEKLIECIGNDLWRMKNEIDKLLNYSDVIKLNDVELLVKPEIDLNIFELIDAMGYKNKVKALKLFNQHLERGADEFYVLSMIVYQLRNLLLVKSTPIAKLKLHPFVIRKSLQQVGNFTFEELKKIYYQLMTIDLRAKTGKADINSALELFLTSL